MEVARPAMGVAAAAMLGVTCTQNRLCLTFWGMVSTCVGRTLFWFEGGGPFPPGPPGLAAIVRKKVLRRPPQSLGALERSI